MCLLQLFAQPQFMHSVLMLLHFGLNLNFSDVLIIWPEPEFFRCVHNYAFSIFLNFHWPNLMQCVIMILHFGLNLTFCHVCTIGLNMKLFFHTFGQNYRFLDSIYLDSIYLLFFGVMRSTVKVIAVDQSMNNPHQTRASLSDITNTQTSSNLNVFMQQLPLRNFE